MIRVLDLMDLSRKEVSVPFQALLLLWSTILLHFQATLLGIKITNDMLWEAGHAKGSFRAHCLTEVNFCHCSFFPPFKIQYCELPNANHQCRLAQLGEKGRATFPFFPLPPPPSTPTSSLSNCGYFRPPHSLMKIWSKIT